MKQITIDEYILKSGKWEESLVLLRELALAVGFEETVKWGMPVYTIGGKNVAALVAFKSYVGIWFYHGVFLDDKNNCLIASEEGTSGLRQWRFQGIGEVRDNIDQIVLYLEEAITNQKMGKVMRPNLNRPIILPEELKLEMENDPLLKTAYLETSKSRKRDYGLYIDRAKTLATRQRRLKKVIQLIKQEKGLI